MLSFACKEGDDYTQLIGDIYFLLIIVQSE